jgi:uridine phosphorylase
MELNTISTLISTLGFPIAVCIYMLYVNTKQTEAHKEEMSKITEAVNDLKVAITSLVDKLTM